MTAPRELPDGAELHTFMPRQTPKPGAIYLAMMDGAMEDVLGPYHELRDREFLIEVEGQRWIATPLPLIFAGVLSREPFAIDTGGVHARSCGERTSIDLQLVRLA